jgi:hypothetical protein
MSGKNKDITKRWWYGKQKDRCWEMPTLRGAGWKLPCNGCYKNNRVEGLGGDLGMSAADVCVGALTDGWKFTIAEQYCPQCWGKFRHKAGAAVMVYLEWWARLLPLPVGLSAACGSIVLGLALSAFINILVRCLS